MKVISLVSVATVLAVANGSSLRESVQDELAAGYKNHPVCNEIFNSWWNVRVAQKTRADITALDATCSQFSNDVDACNQKASRSGAMSTAAKNAACTMVGAKSKRCIANPCNHYNSGECTLQATAGQCFWIDKDMLKKINAYYKAEGITDYTGKIKQYAGHGCYRNPCNSPGEGKSPMADCNSGKGDFKVPGVYECTWCIKRPHAMGCQMTIPNTNAECAPVNTKSDQSSVWERVDNARCQCSDEFTFCSEDVNNRAGEFKRKG